MTLWVTFYDGSSFEIIDMDDDGLTVVDELGEYLFPAYSSDIIHIGEDDSPEYWEAIKNA